jgi:oligopeptide/dipeptide ABC transporter ATP-binding protein
MTALLELRGLTVELPTTIRSASGGSGQALGWVRPVNDVSLRVERGAALGLVGESGSGKTMLALALMGLLPAGARVSGSALYHSVQGSLASEASRDSSVDLAGLGEDEWGGIRGRRIAMVFQEPMTALNPVMRVGAQIAEAVRVHQKGLSRDEVARRVVEALERAAVPEPELRARQYPHELSGGLRQRVMIAMAVASPHGSVQGSMGVEGDSRLLIADEPTTALDVTVQKQILELLMRLRRELGLSLIFITHDLAVVAQVAERVAVMYAGRVVEEGPTDEVLRAPRHPYTEGLLKASPQLSRRELVPIPGMVPGLDAIPPGCAFEPRCAVRKEECRIAVPELRDAGPEHEARCILVAGGE